MPMHWFPKTLRHWYALDIEERERSFLRSRYIFRRRLSITIPHLPLVSGVRTEYQQVADRGYVTSVTLTHGIAAATRMITK